MKCVYCKTDNLFPAKKWAYSAFNVELYHCEKCNKSFKAYFWKGKLSHIISSDKDVKAKIRRFLEIHQEASGEEIAESLHLDISDVLKALLELQKLGIVEGFEDTSR